MKLTSVIAAAAFLWAAGLPAGDVYVDNLKGNDSHPGTSPDRPVATFRQAVALLRPGSTLHLAPTGKVYGEMLHLDRVSGTPARPIVIDGHGAVLSGLTPVASDVPRPESDGRWRISIRKMASNCVPYLFADGRRLTRAMKADAIAPMQFFWDGQSFLFRPESGRKPSDYRLTASTIDSGVALMNSSYIVCRNLISEHHANDGFNVHGNCQGLVFSGIESRYNGDDGFSVHEDVGVTVFDGYFHHNMYGIQDINASRSSYYGIRIADNQIGVNFLGGVHALVDCRITGSRSNAVLLSRGAPGIDQGKNDAGPFYDGTTYIKNCFISGGRESLTLTRRARALVVNTTIVNCANGILVMPDATLELRRSVIADCGGYELAAQGRLIADLNLYATGRLKYGDRKFTGPAEWDAYRQHSGQDRQSQLGPAKPDASGRLTAPPSGYRGGVL